MDFSYDRHWYFSIYQVDHSEWEKVFKGLCLKKVKAGEMCKFPSRRFTK